MKNNLRKFLGIAVLFILIGCDDGEDFYLGPGDGYSAASGSNTGFTIIGDHLYALSFEGLTIFNVADRQMTLQNIIPIPTDAETIFGYQHYLLFGRQNGVSIYDVGENPIDPVYVSEYSHQTACDPVIARDGVAYFTIRSGRGCGENRSNQLVTLDISDPTNPILSAAQNMVSPYGLALHQNSLLVSEGDLGIKQFDITDKLNPRLSRTVYNINSQDLIALDTILISVGTQGVDQFRITEDGLSLLSTLE